MGCMPRTLAPMWADATGTVIGRPQLQPIEWAEADGHLDEAEAQPAEYKQKQPHEKRHVVLPLQSHASGHRCHSAQLLRHVKYG